MTTAEFVRTEDHHPRVITGVFETIAAGAGGALFQYYVELQKAIGNVDPDKFPMGKLSVNIVEELIEGGLPAAAGAMVGLIVYRKKVAPVVGHNSFGEFIFVAGGALGGYATMMFLGAVLHKLTGAADNKWGPFH